MDAGQVIIVLLAILGLCSLMQWMLHLLYRTGGENGILILVLRFSGHREDVEYELRRAREHLRQAEGFACKQLLVVDDGMDASTRRLCELFLRGRPGTSICSGEVFANTGNLQYTEEK